MGVYTDMRSDDPLSESLDAHDGIPVHRPDRSRLPRLARVFRNERRVLGVDVRGFFRKRTGGSHARQNAKDWKEHGVVTLEAVNN